MPISRKRVKANSKIKQQQQQTLITSKILSLLKEQNLITKSIYRQIKLNLDSKLTDYQKNFGTSAKKCLVTINKEQKQKN